jgi:hypothetical protein
MSAPPAPVNVSLPAPPLIVLALASPVRVSAKAEPVMFSIPISVSLPDPVEVPAVRLAVIAEVAALKSIVSVPRPPSMTSFPNELLMVSFPAPAERELALASPVKVSAKAVAVMFSILKTVSLPAPTDVLATRSTE